MYSIPREGAEEGYEDDRDYIATIILLSERLIIRPLHYIMEALFLFCCEKIIELPLAPRNNVAKRFIVETIMKMNNLKVKFMIPKLLEYILR